MMQEIHIFLVRETNNHFYVSGSCKSFWRTRENIKKRFRI